MLILNQAHVGCQLALHPSLIMSPAGTHHIQNLIFCCRPGCGLSTRARQWALDAVTITTQTRMQVLAWRLGASGQEKSPLPDMSLPCGTHTSEFTISTNNMGLTKAQMSSV